MNDLKERLQTVRELLNHARLIRTKAQGAAMLEAADQEVSLQKREEELGARIAEEKLKAKANAPKQPELAHAE